MRVALFLVACVAADINKTKAEEIAVGIMQGFLVNQPDLQQCVGNVKTPVVDAEQAIEDFEKKSLTGVVDGLQELADALQSVPVALQQCNASAQDIEQLKTAIEQIKHPKEFVYHLGKDLLINGKSIFAEINTAISDDHSQNWQDFGLQIGKVLRQLVVGGLTMGDVDPKKEQIAIGLIDGFVGTTIDVTQCMNGTSDPEAAVKRAIDDFETKSISGYLAGLKELSTAMKDMPSVMQACNVSVDEIKKLKSALAQIRNPKKFAVEIEHNLIVNGKPIGNEVFTAMNDYKTQQYQDFGLQIGLALHKLIIGDLHMKKAMVQFDVKEAAEIAGGFTIGFLPNGKDFESCVEDFNVSFHDLEEAIAHFKLDTADGVMAGLKDLSSIFMAMKDALKSCKATEEDVKELIQALKTFHSPLQFAYHVGKDLLVNGVDIYTEITTGLSEFKAHQYENFGIMIGTAARKLIVGMQNPLLV